MTPAQSKWLRERIAAGVRLSDWPARAWKDPPALLIYADDALYAYYLGLDGTAYYYDMDRFAQELCPIGDASKIREVYKRAGEAFPELAGL